MANLCPAHAAERLAVRWRRPEVEDFLGPAESLVGDEEFWRHQQQGLAVFLAPSLSRIRPAAVDRLSALLPAGKATTKPEEMVKAARYGGLTFSS